jgi:hypothetical protein
MNVVAFGAVLGSCSSAGHVVVFYGGDLKILTAAKKASNAAGREKPARSHQSQS